MTAGAPAWTEWHRAVDARDARYDGVFFVAIRSTRIYCRPVCPSRRARAERSRFFASAADAEAAGFRPCLRCRPDRPSTLAPVDAVALLARRAAARIARGDLDALTVGELAATLGVSSRHLRRALSRVFGVSPSECAVQQRLQRAQQLLIGTRMPIIEIAYESGFRSLRRFNAVFRDRCGITPSAMRRNFSQNIIGAGRRAPAADR